MNKIKYKNDRYRKTRGGHSRFLVLSCAHCNHILCHYQKDGPGILKRLYADRMLGYASYPKKLACKHCGELLGVLSVYKKESRPAYNLFVGSIKKRVVAQNKLLR